MTRTARGFFAGFLDRLQVPQSVVQIIIAVLVGLASGVGVWIFKGLIELAQRLAFGDEGWEGHGTAFVLRTPVFALGAALRAHADFTRCACCPRRRSPARSG